MAEHPEIEQLPNANFMSLGETSRALVKSSGSSRIALTLCFFDDASLRQFTEVIADLAAHPEMRGMTGFLLHSYGKETKIVIVRCARKCGAEKLSVETDSSTKLSLRWEGDLEYWAECSAKCIGLLAVGTGHQDLMMRSREGQEVSITFKEQYKKARDGNRGKPGTSWSAPLE